MSDTTLMGDPGIAPNTNQEDQVDEAIGETGAVEPADWLAGLNDIPDEIRNDPSLKPITSLPNLVKSYVNAQKMIGADRLVVPGQDAGDDAWRAIYQKLGVPAEFEDYQVELPETEDEGVKGYFERYLKEAHDAGLLPKQAKKLVEFQTQYAADQAQEAEARWERALEEQVEQFKAEEGEKYNDTVFGAKLVVKQFDDDGAFSKLVEEDPSFGNNPTLIRFLAKISGHLTEDTFRSQAVSNLGTSAEEAQQKLNKIMGDQSGPYWSKEHPDHNRVVNEVNKLMNVVMQG